MKNLIEYLQSDNVRLLQTFFEMKDVEHAQQEQKDTLIKTDALEEYNRDVAAIQNFYETIATQISENNRFIRKNKRKARKVLMI